jgi:hypothetical protein
LKHLVLALALLTLPAWAQDQAAPAKKKQAK